MIKAVEAVAGLLLAALWVALCVAGFATVVLTGLWVIHLLFGDGQPFLG